MDTSLDAALPFIFGKIKAFTSTMVSLMLPSLGGLGAQEELILPAGELCLHEVKNPRAIQTKCSYMWTKETDASSLTEPPGQFRQHNRFSLKENFFRAKGFPREKGEKK